MGAALATLVAYAGLAAMTAIVAERHHPMRIDTVRLGALAAVTITATLVSRAVAVGDGWPTLAWHLLLSGASVGTVAIVVLDPLRRLRVALASPASPTVGLG